MTTRLDLRTMVRRRLADTSSDPVWDDEFLNDAIAEAIRRYSTRVPRQAVVAIEVTTGDRELALPEEVNALRVVRVFDDRGTLWRRWEGRTSEPPVPNAPATGNSTWRAWGTELLLASPAPRTGLWRIEHLAHRTEPADDITPLDIQPDDEDLLIAQTVAIALERRAITDGKRYTGKGGTHPLAAAARSARIDADRLFFERIRKPRGSFFERQAV
ncbi:MAG TPA: hypothetical protein VD789_04595 [Thermomicrobiales bacterium]|nr:hypothetical protein [Thermomicrobiales bacterium]